MRKVVRAGLKESCTALTLGSQSEKIEEEKKKA
jgi:hypothetical protein